MDPASSFEDDSVNMSRVSSMDTLTAYFENTLSNLEVLDGNPNLPEIDDFLNNQTSILGDVLGSSQDDVDLEYQDFSFEEIPSLDEEDKSNSSCSEVEEHENSSGPKKYRQPACLHATNLTIGPWVRCFEGYAKGLL